MADFITIDEYKAVEGISSTLQDDQIEAYIPAVSAFIKNYCNRSLIDYTSTASPKIQYAGLGGKNIYLLEVPIIAIVTVEESVDYGVTYTTLTSGSQYVIDYDLEGIYRVGSEFPSGPNSVKVTYRGGYTTTPADLKQAAIELVTYFLKNEAVPRRSTTSTNLAIEYITSSNLPAHIKRLLDNYRYINT